MLVLVCFSNRNISFSLIVQRKKKVRFEDVDNANKQDDDIEYKSMKGNQGKYVDMICWIKTCILVARSMEISRVLYFFRQDLPPEPHVKMRLLINKGIKTTTMMAVQMMGPTTERRPTKPNQPANNQVCNLY